MPAAKPPAVGPYVEPPKATRADMDGPVTLEPLIVAAAPVAPAFAGAAAPVAAEERAKRTVIVITPGGMDRVESDAVYAAKDVSRSRTYLDAIKALQEGKVDKFQQNTLDKLAQEVGATSMEDLKSMIQKPEPVRGAVTPVVAPAP